LLVAFYQVREARSSIDKGKVPEMPLSMRRETERRRQQASIEMDNRLLLDRLGEAMSRKNIDNVLVPQHFVSYLELQRKKELIKITQENRRLLHRIQHTVPTYHPEEWGKDADKHEEYLRNMTEFPEMFVPPGHRPLASEIEGMPDRFSDHLGGALAVNGSTRCEPSPMHTNPIRTGYSTRRSGQLGKSALRKSLQHHQMQQSVPSSSSNYQKDVDDALAETEAMLRDTFHIQSTPQPPPMPPILQSSAQFNNSNISPAEDTGDDEDDFGRNQIISRPFLPDIHESQPQQKPPSFSGTMRRR
jgi:hypothetical protein